MRKNKDFAASINTIQIYFYWRGESLANDKCPFFDFTFLEMALHSAALATENSLVSLTLAIFYSGLQKIEHPVYI